MYTIQLDSRKECLASSDLQTHRKLDSYQVLTLPDGMKYEWMNSTNGAVPWEALAQYGPTTGGRTLTRGPPYYIAQESGRTIGVVDPLLGNGAILRFMRANLFYSHPTDVCFSVLVVKPK